MTNCVQCNSGQPHTHSDPAALYGHWSTAQLALKAVTEERDKLLLQFEEARKIIEEVSHSPEMKKFYYGGFEQDPCGVHAFTAKYAVKREGLTLGESRNLPYPKPISDDDAKKRQDDTCPACNGRGFLQFLEGGEQTSCALCDGKKKV
jgi:hypothetical protein